MTGTPHQPDFHASSQPACVVAETTTDSREVAEHLASTAVDQGLAACVQFTAIRSYYRWEGEVQNDPEFLLTFKTTAAAAEGPLKEFLDREHPYDEPELIILPITGGSDSYLAWIAESVTHG